MKKFVFIDESIRDQYTIAAVIVPITKVGEYRREMLTLRPKGSDAFHMGNEKKSARHRAVRTLEGIEFAELLVAKVKSTSQTEARQLALQSLLNSLRDEDLNIHLDRTNQEFADRKTLFQFRENREFDFSFIHLNRYLDAGLWGADILAWSAGTPFARNLTFRIAH